MRFHDRRHAGEELAVRILDRASHGDLVDTIVLALPRGGVPVAAQVARALQAPLDVLVARKIGVPGRPESGIGAIVADDPPLFDQPALEMLDLSEDRLGADVARERVELRRREEVYRGGRRPAPVKDRTVILIDDGVATGVTARAALRHLRGREPHLLILAVPVCASGTVDLMRREADDIVCLHRPSQLRSVSEWYDDFDQVGDDEVIETLRGFSPLSPAG
ncbi:phosphoribosyltransferase family protein [Streptomyces sp. NPDC048404]|uniref:phosphoribosyltransferase n=1 Tax=unclassified Streptomyces TaxID=2593676 RepID=UPI00342D612D